MAVLNALFPQRGQSQSLWALIPGIIGFIVPDEPLSAIYCLFAQQHPNPSLSPTLAILPGEEETHQSPLCLPEGDGDPLSPIMETGGTSVPQKEGASAGPFLTSFGSWTFL